MVDRSTNQPTLLIPQLSNLETSKQPGSALLVGTLHPFPDGRTHIPQKNAGTRRPSGEAGESIFPQTLPQQAKGAYCSHLSILPFPLLPKAIRVCPPVQQERGAPLLLLAWLQLLTAASMGGKKHTWKKDFPFPQNPRGLISL